MWGYGPNEVSRRQAAQRKARQSVYSQEKGAEPGGQPNQSVSGDESGGDEKLYACVRYFMIIMTEIVRETRGRGDVTVYTL